MTRVAFFNRGGHHLAIIEPVVIAVGDRLTCRIFDDPHAAAAWSPTIVVLVSTRRLGWFRRRLPSAWIVNLRHGLVGKNGLERKADDTERRFDAVCVGDPFAVERYRRADALPLEIWETGFPQLDRLFRDGRAGPREPGVTRTVLYAPTWNPGLSSAPLLADQVTERLIGADADLRLLIKPHPFLVTERPEWLTWWVDAAARDPRVRVLDPRSDVTEAMLDADVLVSDASSTILEFLALDRPIVLVRAPGVETDPAHDPDDILWRWRDLGEEVTRVDAIHAAVRTAFTDPQARTAVRHRYADLLFGDRRDGRNAARVADRLVDLARRMDAGVAPRSLGMRASVPPGRDVPPG